MAENNQEISIETTTNESQSSARAVRMSLLREVTEKTVKTFIKKLKLIQPLTDIPWSVLQQLQSQVVNQLESNIKSEFEQMYTEENIECLLNGLDRMVEESATTAEQAPQWRPSGSVKADVCPTVVKLKKEKLKALEKHLQDLEAQNKLLQSRMEKKERQLIQTKDKIVNVVEDMEKITQLEKTHEDELVNSTGMDHQI